MIKKVIPLWIKELIRPYITKYTIKKTRENHRKALQLVSQKEKIKVAFFLIYESMWKYEKLHFLLKEDERFDPVVFVCPFHTYGKDIMREEMDRAYKSFKDKGYKAVKTLKDDGTFLDVKKEFKPDLVFFTNPWDHTVPPYLINNFLDTLTCYVPYSFNSSNLNEVHYNRDMQKYCWKVFAETMYNKEQAKIFSDGNGDNFVVTGYPGIDNLLDKTYQPKSAWKSTGKDLKKIIWAPHHTIPGSLKALDYSTFLTYAELMLELAQTYQDKIQFCFKPHPNLKGKLSSDDIWGKDKTEAYYKTWEDLPNGQLAEGDYIDLFLESDAMIHDSGSFLLEYLYTHKPVLFLINQEEVREQFNELGKKALKAIDLGYSKEDMLEFIEDVIIQGKDLRKEQRDAYSKEYLKVPNNKLASENIYDILMKEFELKY